MSQPEAKERVPLGFKVLVGAAAAYLLLRLVQGLVWLVDLLR